MKIIRVSKDTNMDEIELNKCTNKNLISTLKKTSISEGNNDLKLLFQWEYNKNSMQCYGWYDGEAGFENKHELPPYGKSEFIERDSSEELLFGDIFIVKKDNTEKKLLNLTISEYCDFYNFAMGGFDDCEILSSEEEILDEEEEDEDHIIDEQEEQEESEYTEDEEYLEEDTNNY